MMGTEWATMDTILPEKDLHIKGTCRKAGGRIDFWLYNPPHQREKAEGEFPIFCGICKGQMNGYKHCPHCYPEREVSDASDKTQ